MGLLNNLIIKWLSYDDVNGESSNPLKKAWDWENRMLNFPQNKGASDSTSIPPLGSYTVFDGIEVLPQALVAASSVLSMSLASGSTSLYRISVTSGPGLFRTPRTLSTSAASAITIATNNNAVATMTISIAGSFSTVQVGDIVRIPGSKTGDLSGNVFADINSGYWVVLNASSSVITAKRQAGELFEGANEGPIVLGAGFADQFMVYSPNGIQTGDSFELSGTFSAASFGDYVVQQVMPTRIDFVSGSPLPLESGLTLASANDLVFYTNAKTGIYLETDQNAVVRFDSQADDANKVRPLFAGNQSLPGTFLKLGHAYKCVVVNKSAVNKMKLKWIISE